MTTRDMSGRVAIQHVVSRLADDLETEYALLSDVERLRQLLATADYVAHARLIGGAAHQTAALVELAAHAQLWAEALQAEARR